MRLDTYKPEVSVQRHSDKVYWSTQREYKASTWVQLLQLPSSFSFDEALLLCQHSEDEWLAWIPDHGEAVLNTSQFCLASC
ncbi:MAG: hypothetical protein NVS2B14_16120 [Chamaesiphon sp.]